MTATKAPAPIFEDLAIRQIEQHFDETPTCQDCDAAADVAVHKVCCPNQIALCTDHYTKFAHLVAIHLPNGIDCKQCPAVFLPPQTFWDIFRVVNL
jgi:hypothetical protein